MICSNFINPAYRERLRYLDLNAQVQMHMNPYFSTVYRSKQSNQFPIFLIYSDACHFRMRLKEVFTFLMTAKARLMHS